MTTTGPGGPVWPMGTLSLKPPKGWDEAGASAGNESGRRLDPPLHRPLRFLQAPSLLFSPPQAPHNCFPMLLMETRLMMPKPWVGGGGQG